MKFSIYLRNRIIEKHGTFRKAAEILRVPEYRLTKWVADKWANKIWLRQIDEWDEKLNLSLVEDIDLRRRVNRLEEEIFKDTKEPRVGTGQKLEKKGNPSVKSYQSQIKGDKGE